MVETNGVLLWYPELNFLGDAVLSLGYYMAGGYIESDADCFNPAGWAVTSGAIVMRNCFQNFKIRAVRAPQNLPPTSLASPSCCITFAIRAIDKYIVASARCEAYSPLLSKGSRPSHLRTVAHILDGPRHDAAA
jgi:hypothetical protein